jgi:hypothetical protein
MSQEQTAEEIYKKHYKIYLYNMMETGYSEGKAINDAMEEYATLKLQEQAKEIEELTRSRDDVFHELEGTKEHNKQLQEEIERLKWFERQFKRQLRRNEQLSNNTDMDYGVGDLD